MTLKSDIRAEADRLRAAFEARGAETVEADILQPAGGLLDLYGEDIRGRAFVTQDPVRGEMMLRPDFTVPLVRRHMDEGRGQARYTYAGEVFRRQEEDPERASEYLQVGYELFNGMDPAEADAEVFAAIAEILAPLDLAASMGDIGLLQAAIAGLETSEARKARLVHHLWRPRRFKALLEGYARVDARDIEPARSGALEIGLRTRAEVDARLDAMREDRQTQPLPAEAVAWIDALLAVEAPASEALAVLAPLVRGHVEIAPAIDALAARLDALAARGVDLSKVRFAVNYGRTTLEYYNGFVFGFEAADRSDLPPVATGGRYDALTRAIGGGNGVPAVGGVIRPGLTLELGGRP